MKSQRGAYLAFMALLMAALIGLGAFSVDLGRLFVLRSEMQNAADSAALSAAFELNFKAGARSRAEASARYILQHRSRFADTNELLGSHITVEFFCAIGSEFDPSPAKVTSFCTNGYVNGRSIAANDREARYVRVSMVPSGDKQAYSLGFLFAPVLDASAEGSRAYLTASAVAGRNFFVCGFSHMMICNPFETTGQNLPDVVEPGQQFILNTDGESWAPGNFGFIQPSNKTGGGAGAVSEYLADENSAECIRSIFTTSTGKMTQSTTSGMNTRFDVYAPPAPFNRPDAPDRWPPAPNVINYPQDQTWRAEDARYGYGDWDRNTYFSTYHDWQGYTRPPGWPEMTRWEVYNWEISESKLPSKSPLKPKQNNFYDGIPDPDHLYFGTYPPAESVPERRLISAVVINCTAQELAGSKSFSVTPPEGFAKLFLTQTVSSPPNAIIFAEYVSWTEASDRNYHIDIQLYE